MNIFPKLSKDFKTIAEASTTIALSNNFNAVEPEHVMLALVKNLKEGSPLKTWIEQHCSLAELEALLQHEIKIVSSAHRVASPPKKVDKSSERLYKLLMLAHMEAIHINDNKEVRVEHVFLGWLQENEVLNMTHKSAKTFFKAQAQSK